MDEELELLLREEEEEWGWRMHCEALERECRRSGESIDTVDEYRDSILSNIC